MPSAQPPARIRGRFAPSPTGPLHLGSLTSALGSWLSAHARGGEWLVRIEDLDPPREVAGMAGRQLAALAAFGLVSDAPVVRQSERGELYSRSLDRLIEQGLAFACRCSRTDLAATGGVHVACVQRPSGPQPAWRLRVPERELDFCDRIRGRYTQSLRADSGDFVLRRADGYWAYQLAVVVDDAEQGISEVVRGADLLESTPRQIFLQQCLGLPTPDYAHLPVLLDSNGLKLSKSLASAPVDPDDPLPALRRAWRLLGQDGDALTGARSAGHLLKLAAREFDHLRTPAKDQSAAM